MIKQIITKHNLNVFQAIDYFYYGGYRLDEISKDILPLYPNKVDISITGVKDEGELFLLNQLNGCELACDINYNRILFVKGNKTLFQQDVKKGYFWMDYYSILVVLNTQYDMNVQQIEVFIRDMVDKHLGLKGYTAPQITLA